MTDAGQWFYRRGELRRGAWQSVVDDSIPGWRHTGIRVGVIAEGESLELDGAGCERMIVPLSGRFSVLVREAGETSTITLAGRSSVFDGPTDVLYLASGAAAIVGGRGRFAVAESPTELSRATTHLPASAVPVELRGAGASSREVRNFGVPGVMDAARLIVCEVITPAGNWSSYPPHKHDEHVPGRETRLEEIYYFEAEPVDHASSSAEPFGLFTAYSSPAGSIEIDGMVRSGDIALIPFGYHGPAVAAPGYNLYYLNVMAGPGPEREWLITDDPAHAWIRGEWASQVVDARLPFEKKGQQ